MLRKLSLLIILIGFLGFTAAKAQTTTIDSTRIDTIVVALNPVQFNDTYKKVQGQLVDVRTPQEYKKWHYANAKCINYYDKDFPQQLALLDKTIPVFVYCSTGGRSFKSAGLLEQLGFKKVYYLKGFYTDLQDLTK